METIEESKKKVFKALFILIIILLVYFAAKTYIEIKMNSMFWEMPVTIILSGYGEVSAAPDIANVYFTISKESKTVKEAQIKVAEIEKKALDFLKTKGVEEKDIKAENASVYPKYDYVRKLCPQSGAENISSPVYDCGGKQVLSGYEASESITVKIRNTDDAGAIMQGLGATGVSNLSGPNFSIDDEDALKAEARKKAIDDAKEKAKVLAKDLGVRLGKITSFNEGGNPVPMMYKTAGMGDDAESSSAPARLPKGENTISSDVTITYEIR